MKGTVSGRSRAFGGKPVINEPIGRRQASAVAERGTSTGVMSPSSPVGKSGSKMSGKGKLKEGVRLFRAKCWDDSLKELMNVDSDGLGEHEKTELSYYLALCFTKVGRLVDATPYFEQVVAASEDLLRVYQCRMTLAYIHVTTGRPKMAEFELGRLLDSGFESAQLFNTMAYAAYSRKHYRHAIEYYEKALKLDDSNATALNSMGYILVDTGIDPAKGLRYCRKAVDIQPENAAYLDSLGWACYKCKEPAAARTWLRKAFELAPHETTIREHLRMVTGGGGQ